MPIGTRSRQGIASVVTGFDPSSRPGEPSAPRLDLICTVTRWKTPSTALGLSRAGRVRHGRTPSLLLVEAAGSETVNVDEVINRAKVSGSPASRP